MTTTHDWELWDGTGFPSDRFGSTIYYYPGKVDIEDPDNLHSLIGEIFMDGVAESQEQARALLEKAIVVHGQTIEHDGQLQYHLGPKDEYFDSTREATWVELVGLDD